MSDAPGVEVTSSLATLTVGLPNPWPHDPVPDIRARLLDSGERLVAFDDDPTGSQAVYDVPLLTEWDESLLEATLSEAPVAFVLTNTRSLEQHRAEERLEQAANHAASVARRLGHPLRVLSRSDSTLRGHFPAEIDALRRGLGQPADLILLTPAFMQGRRVTVGDVHWVRNGDELTPVSATEFAQDPAFGFSTSRLPAWVEEKSRGRISAESCVSLGLSLVREGGPDAVAAELEKVDDGRVVISNALDERDVEVIAAGAQLVELQGRAVRHRCGASMVRARAGLAVRPLLTGDAVRSGSAGPGLIVCGSHVPMSTAQLEALNARDDVEGVEIDVPSLVSDPGLAETLAADAAREVDRILDGGRNAALSTSRALNLGNRSPLEVAQLVSDTVVRAVQAIRARPAFVVGKGGITSHDVATRALGIREAVVLGQIAPGVSVWRAREATRPGVPYLVFPGNVGDEQTLADVVGRLTAAQ